MAFGNTFFGKKIIITGHTGFKGSWMATWLLQLGAKVYGIAKDVPTDPALFDALKLRNRVTHFQRDIRDLSAMRLIFNEVQPDFVFHMAAQPIVAKSYQDPIDTMSTNIIGTANILEALRHLENPCHTVIITSDKCYDNVEWTWGYRETDAIGGKDPYSASKGAAELMVKTYYHSFFSKADSRIKVVSVRAGNVIGGGDWAANRMVPDCIRAWNKGHAVQLRNPDATRPWQHVLEPLSGYLLSAQALTNGIGHGEAYNFGPAADQNFTVKELLDRISTHWEFKKMANHFIPDNSKKFHEAGLLKLNCDKALNQLKWKSVLNFEQAASFTAVWYREYYSDSGRDMFSFACSQIKDYVGLASEKGLEWTHS